MSIVLNSVLEGIGISTTDTSRVITSWSSVKVGSITYTFCRSITHDVTLYVRDIAHKDVMIGNGYDYYPCYNGSTIGLYNAADHTFITKSGATKTDDVAYGVSIGDLRSYLASGYSDLLAIAAEDGGLQEGYKEANISSDPYDDKIADYAYLIADIKLNSDRSFHSLVLRQFAFALEGWKEISSGLQQLERVPLPQEYTDGDGYIHIFRHLPTYGYEEDNPYNLPLWQGPANSGALNIGRDYKLGELIYGRRPRWQLWADTVDLGRGLTRSHVASSQVNAAVTFNIFNQSGNIGHHQLFLWNGYNSQRTSKPYLRLAAEDDGDGVAHIETHNGTIQTLTDYLSTMHDIIQTDNRVVWMSNDVLPTHAAIGNIPRWSLATDEFKLGGMWLVMHYARLNTNSVGVNNTDYDIKRMLVYADNNDHNKTVNEVMASLSPGAKIQYKKMWQKGLNNNDTYHDWGFSISGDESRDLAYHLNAGDNIYMSLLIDVKQSVSPYLLCYDTLNVPAQIDMVTLKDKNNLNTPTQYYSNFRFVLQTPTVTIGGVTYDVVPAYSYDTPYLDIPSRYRIIGGDFFIQDLNTGSGISTAHGGGIGWRFALRRTVNSSYQYLQNRNTTASYAEITTARLKVSMEIYTMDSGVMYYHKIENKKAQITDTYKLNGFPVDTYANTRFDNLYGYQSRTDSDLAYSAVMNDEYIYRIAFFYNEIPITKDSQEFRSHFLKLVQTEYSPSSNSYSGNPAYVVNPDTTVIVSIASY